MIRPAFPRTFANLAFAAILGLGACKKEDPPFYNQLTAEQRTWTAPYQANTEWRFRSNRGVERTYRVQRFSDQKLDFPRKNGQAEGYIDIFEALFYRADTVAKPMATFLLTGQRTSLAVNPAHFHFEHCFTDLPINELATQQPLPAGYELLPLFTTSTGTYQNVLHYHFTQPVLNQSVTGDVFYTKEQGVVRYVSKGLTWDRL
ncbi:hypothetical protein [Hymenobacter cavernae]|uniref:DUF5025 domain-containing protein n=1 Tax=Hymenobacter cavernae TaxID=2044852 RepID=A0ABQ1TIK1_9BACT|nr:hypothetical protein [Hymenobacter cavernae]GGE93708.1 hypothetical protein GCM10011383_00520 [Hymenobacter cavernae]